VQFQHHVLVFIIKTRYLAFKTLISAVCSLSKKEGSHQECNERKQQRARKVTDFVMVIATFILWQIKSEKSFSFTDRPWFPFHSMSSSKQVLRTSSHVLYNFNFKCLFRQLALTCSDTGSYLCESKWFRNCLDWEESQHFEQTLETVEC